MRWQDFAAQQPALAKVGVRKFTDPQVVLVATIRQDGTPRVSPVEPLIWTGDLWLSMGIGSRKAMDLRRDPRILVHSVVTSRNGETGEFKLRGTAAEESSGTVHAGYAQAVADGLGWRPQLGRFHLFRVELDDVTFIRWDDATNDQYVTRWPAGTEFVRRGTSATSLGPPEPYAELLR
jgi:hypothetical protein